MSMNTVPERLAALRAAMKANGVDVYLIPVGDPHSSEYLPDHYTSLTYFSGFHGENSNFVVTMTESAVWADGRYFVQAEKEIAGTEIQLMRMGEPGVPTAEEYCGKVLPEGGTLGLCGLTANCALVNNLKKVLEPKHGSIKTLFLEDELWVEGRPARPATPAWILPKEYAGFSPAEKLEQLLLYQNASDGIAGWNDGKRIGINVDNTITGSFLELEQKSDSLVGILGHECGHARFTDSRLRRVYIQKMQAGTWYPDAPEPENEDEESALTEMNTYLTKKDPAVLSLLTECASYISYLLNDVYIEEKMCSLFPGSINKGILVNRRRNVEWIPPLKELLEGNPDPVSVFLKVLVQYALRGYVNFWNMESCEMLDTLNEVKQLVDLSVEADSDLIRYQAANRILLKKWKYFRKLLE